MIKLLTKLLVKYCEATGNVHYIKGGSNQDVFLVRYIVFKSKLGCLYIHRFLKSDADDPHNHPWNFFTYVVEHGYLEKLHWNEDPAQFKLVHRKPGSLARRKATDIHRVVLTKEYKLEELEKAPLTLCLMGPRIQEWGFYTERGFINWKEYLNIQPGDPRIAGSE